ncbi:MAG: hypothetical protein M1360_04895 [Candidatus Marsarchaeota archaeon]|jgi:thymidylate kinase|nr:hypothetical protein [Candidatus Marsarchaeota archaeon]MCL5419242.1 hypothetical protein [Candidatus Marsarchaeota archaeon]
MHQGRFLNEHAVASASHDNEQSKGALVYIEGKPGTGKTTQARILASTLNSSGISAKDVDGAASGSRSDLLSIGSYMLHYGKGMLKAVSVQNAYDVVIVQHVPSYFTYSFNLISGYNSISLVQRAMHAPLDMMAKPAAVFYLYADMQVLLERLEGKAGRIDAVHKLLLRADDSAFVAYLKHLYGYRFIMVDASKSKEKSAAEIYAHMGAMATLRK